MGRGSKEGRQGVRTEFGPLPGFPKPRSPRIARCNPSAAGLTAALKNGLFIGTRLDEKGRVIKYLGETSSSVTKDTKVALGKYNAKDDTWEAGDETPNSLWGDLFKDPGAKSIVVRIIGRADRRGIAQILVRQIGEKGRK